MELDLHNVKSGKRVLLFSTGFRVVVSTDSEKMHSFRNQTGENVFHSIVSQTPSHSIQHHLPAVHPALALSNSSKAMVWGHRACLVERMVLAPSLMAFVVDPR